MRQADEIVRHVEATPEEVIEVVSRLVDWWKLNMTV
jgi:hypothetical protein